MRETKISVAMDAVQLLETYGQYPIAHTFANNEHGIPAPDPTDL
jgi:hypothetical protein